MSQAAGYRHTLGWNLGFSSYWFAVSYKWFVLLFIMLPDQVSRIVPGGEKNSAWGLVLGTGAVWAIFGPAIFGRLNETARGKWRDRRRWIALGAVLTCVALAMLATAPSLTLLALGYFVLQVADDLGTGPYAGMVADTVPEDHRGYASSIMGALKLGGQLLSGVVALVCILAGQTGLVYPLIGLITVVGAGLTLLTLGRPILSEKADEERRAGNWFEDWVTPFRSRDFRLVWFNRFLSALAFGCISAYTLNFLKDMYGPRGEFKIGGLGLGTGDEGAKATALILALLIALAGVVGSVYAARVLDRIGRKPLMIWGGLATALFLLPLAGFPPLSVVFGWLFLFGIGNGMYHAADWALVSDILPNKERASTEMGVWQSSETSTQLIVGGVGWMVDALNRGALGQGYQALLVVAMVMFVASVACVPGIRGTR